MINGLMKIRKQLMETRRAALEKYLRCLLCHEEICKSIELRKFLCHQQILNVIMSSVELQAESSKRSYFRNIFVPTEESFGRKEDFVEGTRVNPSINSDTSFASPRVDLPVHLFDGDPLSFPTNTSVTTHITDLLVELFELKDKTNWLRRQAIVIFLQQLFGDTVERRTMDYLRWAVGYDNASYLLSNLRDTYWPHGVWNTVVPIRTDEMKLKTKQLLRGKIHHLFKQLASVIGKTNTSAGANMWFQVFQNRILNLQLLYTVLDKLLPALFAERPSKK